MMRQRPQLLIFVRQADMHVIELLLIVVQRLADVLELSYRHRTAVRLAEQLPLAPAMASIWSDNRRSGLVTTDTSAT